MSAERHSLEMLVEIWHVNHNVAGNAQLLERLPRYAPELGWQAILEVLQRLETEKHLSDLARCLKTLIVQHGARFIERVEEEALTNPRFKACLGHVDADPAARIPTELWDRLTRAAGRRIGPVSPGVEGLFDEMPDLGTALYWDAAPLDPENPPSLTQADLERLAEDWIKHSDTFWACDEVMAIVRDEEPNYAYDVIYRLFQSATTDEALGDVAAGPLEDLLSDHGESIIERVERTAAADPRFRQCLEGVWRTDDMSDALWARIVRARGA